MEGGFVGICIKAAGQDRIQHPRTGLDRQEEQRTAGNVFQRLKQGVRSLEVEAVGIENHDGLPIGSLAGEGRFGDNRADVFNRIRGLAALFALSEHFFRFALAENVLTEFHGRFERDDFGKGRFEKFFSRGNAETRNFGDGVESGKIRTDYRGNRRQVEVARDGLFEFWGHCKRVRIPYSSARVYRFRPEFGIFFFANEQPQTGAPRPLLSVFRHRVRVLFLLRPKRLGSARRRTRSGNRDRQPDEGKYENAIRRMRRGLRAFESPAVRLRASRRRERI